MSLSNHVIWTQMYYLLRLWSFTFLFENANKIRHRRMRHILPPGKDTGPLHSATHHEWKEQYCLSAGGVRPVSTSLSCAPVASRTAHCTLSEQHNSCHCALMDCWWLRPSAHPNEDTEGGNGGCLCVCVFNFTFEMVDGSIKETEDIQLIKPK